MDGTNHAKRILAVLFPVILIVFFIGSKSWTQIPKFASYLGNGPGGAQTAEKTPAIIESEYSSGLLWRRSLLELNGEIQKDLKIRDFYKDIGLYITDDRYIVSAEPYTTTDYEYEQTVALKEFLDENGIQLLYVNEPTKYGDDALFEEQFGVESWCNRNADRFLERIREAGVPVLDLRESAAADGLKIEDLFYRTDHHWTTRAGLWAVRQMAGAMNESCGYSIDPSLYDISNYTVTKWENCWLGEQGRKVSGNYVGLDDYEEIKPAFETDFTFKNKKGKKKESGSFDLFIDETPYDLETDIYLNGSWHYSYRQRSCINNLESRGKVLMLTDSYDQVTEPFLALGVHETDSVLLREHGSEYSIRDRILKKGYDTVLICYAEFMIGAHDNPDSTNYRMFQFD